MPDAPKPSATAVNQAVDLGRFCGANDAHLKPILEDAYQYLSYVQFMVAHRHQLQQAPAFQQWDAKLQHLIDTEVKRCGLQIDDPHQWEAVETSLAVPLRCAFWFGWETVQELKHKFEHAVATWNAAHPIQPQRNSPAAPTPTPNPSRHADPLAAREDWEASPGQDIPHSPAIVRNAEGVRH